MKPPTVVTVLRTAKGLSRGEYEPAHVQTLMYQIAQCWPSGVPLRRVVLSDVPVNYPELEVRPLSNPWPGWWAKMELFSPVHMDLGTMLYFDLDTLIAGSLEDIVEVSYLTALQDFYRPHKMASGMMCIPTESRPRVWREWCLTPAPVPPGTPLFHIQPEYHMRRHQGDQDFLATVWANEAERWQTLLPGQVCSYKVHVQPWNSVPEGVRVICFHGKPRPWQVDPSKWGTDARARL